MNCLSLGESLHGCRSYQELLALAYLNVSHSSHASAVFSGETIWQLEIIFTAFCLFFILPFSFSSWEKESYSARRLENRYQQTFLIKKQIKWKQGEEWQTAGGRVFQTCLLLVCLIRTWHSWHALHQNAIYEYSPDHCKEVIRFSSKRIAFLKNKDNTVYCVLYILWSVLCIKIQLRDQSDEPWNTLLCCAANVCLFCFCALKTVTSHDAGRELNMNVWGTRLV